MLRQFSGLRDLPLGSVEPALQVLGLALQLPVLAQQLPVALGQLFIILGQLLHSMLAVARSIGGLPLHLGWFRCGLG